MSRRGFLKFAGLGAATVATTAIGQPVEASGVTSLLTIPTTSEQADDKETLQIPPQSFLEWDTQQRSEGRVFNDCNDLGQALRHEFIGSLVGAQEKPFTRELLGNSMAMCVRSVYGEGPLGLSKFSTDANDLYRKLSVMAGLTELIIDDNIQAYLRVHDRFLLYADATTKDKVIGFTDEGKFGFMRGFVDYKATDFRAYHAAVVCGLINEDNLQSRMHTVYINALTQLMTCEGSDKVIKPTTPESGLYADYFNRDLLNGMIGYISSHEGFQNGSAFLLPHKYSEGAFIDYVGYLRSQLDPNRYNDQNERYEVEEQIG